MRNRIGRRLRAQERPGRSAVASRYFQGQTDEFIIPLANTVEIQAFENHDPVVEKEAVDLPIPVDPFNGHLLHADQLYSHIRQVACPVRGEVGEIRDELSPVP